MYVKRTSLDIVKLVVVCITLDNYKLLGDLLIILSLLWFLIMSRIGSDSVRRSQSLQFKHKPAQPGIDHRSLLA
jgi:hypothetical protein